MGTRVYESAVISKSIDAVWAAIRNLDFAFSSAVSNTELDGKVDWDDVGGVRRVTYTDKTVQTYRLLELSDATRSLSFELVSSTPAVTYMASNTSWKLKRITHDNSTLLESVTDFSKDASTAVVADAKYKKLEQFRDLRAYLSGGVAKRTFGLGGRESKIPPQGIPGTKHERSFIAVKPDGVQRSLVGEIIGRFEKRGYKLVALKMTWPTKEKAEGHYDDLKARPFFPGLEKILLIWTGCRYGMGRFGCNCWRSTIIG